MLVTIVSLINIIIMLIALTKSSNSKLNLRTYLLFCSPDPTTNSETKNLNFHEFFDQFEQVLCMYLHFFCQN